MDKEVLENMLKEYKESGLSADEFVLKVLKDKGSENPEEDIEKLNRIFKEIDKSYLEIKECKENGVSRENYLKKVIDRVTSGLNPKNIGKVLSGMIFSFRNVPHKNEETAIPYNDDTDVDYVMELSDAIKEEVITGISTEEE